MSSASDQQHNEGFNLSAQQAFIWSVMQANPDKDDITVIKVKAKVSKNRRFDEQSFTAAVKDLTNKYEILRTRFVKAVHLEILFQVIEELSRGNFEVNVIDCDALSKDEITDHVNNFSHLSYAQQCEGIFKICVLRYKDFIEYILSIPALLVDEYGALNILSDLFDPSKLDQAGEEEVIQYVDISEWFGELRNSEEFTQSQIFWQREIEDHYAGSYIPFSGLLEVESSADDRGYLLDDACSKNVQYCAKSFDVTDEIICLASLVALLYKLTSGMSVNLGVKLSGREDEELLNLIGCLQKKVPVKIDIQQGLTFKGLVALLSDKMDDYRKWQEYFNYLDFFNSDDLGMNVQFSFYDVDKILSASIVDEAEVLASVDIDCFTIKVQFLRGQFRVSCLFDKSIYGIRTAKAILDAYVYTLRTCVTQPNVALDKLAINISEPKLSIPSYGPKNLATVSHQTILDMLFDRYQTASLAKKHAVAVQDSESIINYVEFFEQVKAFAAVLINEYKIRPGQRVGVACTRNVDLIVSIFSVVASGATLVPIEPGLPESRISHIVSDSGLTHIISNCWTESFTSKSLDVNLIVYNKLGHFTGFEYHRPDLHSGMPVYLIYTSGTSGVPKGVTVSHRALLNYICSIQPRLMLSPDACMATLSGYGADLGYTALFVAPLTGRKLCMISESMSRDAVSLAVFLQQSPIDCLKVVPGHLAALLSELDDTQAKSILPRQSIVLGGDTLNRSLIERIRALAPDSKIINHYGPTEATIGALTSRIESTGAPVLIGSPIDNISAYVLDEDLNYIPAAMVGELYLGGAGVAEGYHNQPGRTAQAFIPDPFSKVPGARLYKTGDKVRSTLDADIQFIGRSDNQVKIRGFRVELDEIANNMKAFDSVEACAVVLAKMETERPQLLAYVVMSENGNLDQLKSDLAKILPDYMIPSLILETQSLPLKANGKVDYAKLPSPDSFKKKIVFTPPSTEQEKILSRILSDLLKLEAVSIHDNFFELGGDSIIGIQLAARARRYNLHISVEMIFNYPTIYQLAQQAEQIENIDEISEEDETEEFLLTPIQKRFFDYQHIDAHHYNQTQLLSVDSKVTLSKTLLIDLAGQLLSCHSGLRRKFYQNNSAEWVQSILPMNDVLTDRAVHYITERYSNDTEWESSIKKNIEHAQKSLCLEDGNIFRILWIDGGGSRDSRLFFVIHHLAIDYVSWNILMDDFMLLLEQYNSDNQNLKLPPPSMSVKQWGSRLNHYAKNALEVEEKRYWYEMMQYDPTLPVDFEVPYNDNTIGVSQILDIWLDRGLSDTLTQEIPSAYGFDTQELLIAALSQAISSWSARDQVLIELESHGRDNLGGRVDLVRTVAWFTSRYPVCVNTDKDIYTTLKNVRNRLRSVPNHGIGYGLLKYTHKQKGQYSLAELQEPVLSFNYFGQSSNKHTISDSPFKLITDTGGERSSKQVREHLITFNSSVVEGSLLLRVVYSRKHHKKETVDKLLNGVSRYLQKISDLIKTDNFQSFTPADFPETGMKQQELDDWLKAYYPREVPGKLEMLYPVSPIQQGMIFHSLLAPDSGVYILQLVTQMQGNLNLEIFKKAWSHIIRRHTALRTSFLGLKSGKPMQCVEQDLPVPWEIIEWSNLSESEQKEQLDKLLENDRIDGFDLTSAPLLRLKVILLGGERYYFIWVRHHAIIDGWSSSIVMNEVFYTYKQLLLQKPPTLPPTEPYRNYIAWLANREGEESAEQFWKTSLENADVPTPLCIGHYDMGSGFSQNEVLSLNKEMTSALKHFAASKATTLNIITQAAWSVVLAVYSERNDIVFGATSAGRPENLADVENMVGPFINTLPVRVRVEYDDIEQLLLNLHHQQMQRDRFSHTPLVDIQRYAGIAADTAMFQSLFIFENFPESTASEERTAEDKELVIVDAKTLDKTNYPLTLLIVPFDELRIRFNYLPEYFSSEVVAGLLDLYRQVLNQFSSGFLDKNALEVKIPLVSQLLEAHKNSLPCITLSGTFSLDPLPPVMEFWGDVLLNPVSANLMPYNQVVQQLIDPKSISSLNHNGFNAILLRWEDWLGDAGITDLKIQLNQFLQALSLASKNHSTPYIVMLCPSSDRKEGEFRECFTECRKKLFDFAADYPAIYVCEATDGFNHYFVDGFHDETGNELGHLPYTGEAYSILGTMLIRYYDSFRRLPYKVIVLDCDNTLWKGVVGEDGIKNIAISEPYRALQKFMLQKKDQGILLCLCSKNNFEDVAEAFKHEKMLLDLGDITAYRVNWEAKSENLRSLSEELGLHLNSFIFIDDDPTQCHEVRSNCPEVATFQLPKDEDQIPEFIKNIWLLDKHVTSEEDKNRASYYSDEKNRESLKSDSLDIESYIASLAIKYEFSSLSDDNIQRVCDLILRTNQFNFTSERITLSEVNTRIANQGMQGIVTGISDRFGDYGQVGVILYHCEGELAVVDNMLLSCRALGRGVELKMLRNLSEVCRKADIEKIKIHLTKTERNIPAQKCFDLIMNLPDCESLSEFDLLISLNSLANIKYPQQTKNPKNKSNDNTQKKSIPEPSGALICYQKIADRWRSSSFIHRAVLKRINPVEIARAEYEPASTRTQVVIVSIYEEILSIENVGLHDNFFSLGGNSLKAVQLAGMLREQFSVEVSLQAIFEAPIVNDLSDRVDLLVGISAMQKRSDDEIEMDVVEF